MVLVLIAPPPNVWWPLLLGADRSKFSRMDPLFIGVGGVPGRFPINLQEPGVQTTPSQSKPLGQFLGGVLEVWRFYHVYKVYLLDYIGGKSICTSKTHICKCP